jgi:hypothetical protein
MINGNACFDYFNKSWGIPGLEPFHFCSRSASDSQASR